MITCRTLGPIDIVVDQGPAVPELLWRKNVALLIYLARSGARGRTREHLMSLLWPDKPQEAARHSLNEAMRPIRRWAGEGGVQSTATQIRLTPESVRLDVDELVSYAAKEHWEAASGLISGEFMEGFSVPEASEYEDWLATERQHWRGMSVDVLVRRADELERMGRAGDASGFGLRALELDPHSERALRCAIRCLALCGERAAALQHYDEFKARLQADLDIPPGRYTTDLADHIRNQRDIRPAAAGVTGASPSDLDAPPPLVERETQLGLLLAAELESRRARRSALLVIEGEAGNGKSRVLQELTNRLRLDGVAVVFARAVQGDLGDSYGGVLALARGGLLEAPAIAGAQATALRAFARSVPEWEARFSNEVLQGEILPLGRALVEILRAVAEERPIALALDDAHWLDRKSALVLGRALRDLGGLPLSVTLALQSSWPRAEFDEIRSRIGREIGGTVVSLAPLGRAGVSTLAKHFLPRYSPVDLDRVVRRVSTDSAGIPFLIVELLRAVAHGLDLGRIAGTWPEPFKTLDQTMPGELPDAVVAAFRVTYRRLSPRAQSVLAAAAVIGNRTDAPLLARATELTPRQVQAALDELEWHQWLVADARGYSFGARLVREVISQDMVTAGQRRRILAARDDALPVR
jgi:DNA-binding SARP family transcriptional activator